MKIWAHRGCSYACPENTLQAFKAACQYPITGIELDIQLTKDRKMVVIHDEKVDRTTDGTGQVCDFTLEELKNLNIAVPTSGPGESAYTQIPTIEEVFELVKPYCLKNGVLINIELKNSQVRYEGMEDMILETVSRWGLENYIVYSSFNPQSVRLLKEKNPSVKTGILATPLSECLSFAEKYPVDALHPNIKKIDVEDLRSKTNLPVRAWNTSGFEPFYPDTGAVEIQNLEELVKAGVTDIFTNVPERYLQKSHETAAN
ncbi:glycerophosphodiester phosphodiesterase family protein [Parablautia intestinalis]|uniref:glycerophosphodiester phosphodiesterase family protein n=1 Tax=Parablautia intestinalis TaxID=2320100 RepID=UPI00256F62C0|nr:glycerophosphodiester phosphodiesterase family protein [Parablautia intestinalis]